MHLVTFYLYYYICKWWNYYFHPKRKIQDIDILLDRAIDQKNDAPTYVVKEIKNNCKLTINGEEQSTTPLVTTELLYSDNNSSEYAATVISELEVYDNTLRAVSSYSKEEHTSSSGGEIYLYTTIYFDISNVNGVGIIFLKKVTVNAKVNVSRVKVNYVKAKYGYAGVNYNTRGWENTTSTWYSETGTSKTVYVNGPKLESVSGGMYYNIWGEGLAHVARGNSSWDTTHKVIECDMGWWGEKVF